MAKVYLVGVGCGDPGLVSLRAQALIEQADCVLYDHLLDRSEERRVGKECG